MIAEVVQSKVLKYCQNYNRYLPFDPRTSLIMFKSLTKKPDSSCFIMHNFPRLNYHTNFPKSCDDCGLVLSTKHAFVKHVNTLHSTAFQESTVPCEICGKLGRVD